MLEGNQNARKEEHGLTVSFYVNAEHITKLRAICRRDGRVPSDENVRMVARNMARSIMEDAIKVLDEREKVGSH